MRVAWDLQAVTGPGRTGLGVSVQFLLDALMAHAPDVEVTGLWPNATDTPLKGVADRLRWEQWRLPRDLRREHRRQLLDLAYSPALGAPLVSPVPVVAHVHDLIPLHYPHLFRGVASRWYWRHLLPATWRRCRALTVSNRSVADDIAENLHYPAGRIHVIPYYPDPAVATAAAELKPGYAEISDGDVQEVPLFLTLGSHEWRKNVETAIAAVGELKRRGVTARLTCIGGHAPQTNWYRMIAAHEGITDQVEFPGYLERPATVRLLLDCTALVFMSHYEGYGMPPQEAQSVGCAVVLSDIPSHRTVYDDGARWGQLGGADFERPPLLPTEDHAQLADAMQRLIAEQGYRGRLRRSGLAYSATFSAEQTASALRAAFTAARG